MYHEVYDKIVEKSMEPEALERTIVYLEEHLGAFLRKKERVLICFRNHREGDLSWLMEQAVLRCGAVPVVWGPQRTWKNLMRQAFSNKVTAIIGTPLVLLGLTKLIKHNATPLFIRKVISSGYPCPEWMVEGIVKGFDCEMGGCFGFEQTGVVAGFACGHSSGVHLRMAEYGVDIVDEQGNILPDGEMGEMVLYPKSAPELRYPMGENARIAAEECPCHSTSPRLLEMGTGRTSDPDLEKLGEYLQSWTSVLDCRLKKGESGLEIELVVFQGEKLPKLPTAAKLVVRPWSPEKDEPFPYYNLEKKMDF